MTWVNDLDALASAGVIGFDAPAYIRGVQPRYVGNLPLEGTFDQLPQIKQQPKKDEFSNNSAIHNPSWKKWLFGGIAAAGLIFAGFKLKCLKNPFKSLSTKGLPSKIWTGIKNTWTSFKGLFKKP